jgi:magnesium-transporting ATPase (P-type)
MELNLATNLFIVYMIYFIIQYIKIGFNKKNLIEHKEKRKRLNYLRTLPFKTHEQQLEFLDLKYPKTEPFKWNIKNVSLGVVKIGLMIFIFLMIKRYWRNNINFLFSLWQVILIVLIVPIIINKILKKFGIENDDILIFFGGNKK